jgi:hypothetical protein
MGPRNAYKDMLDNVVSPITCVSMNHQNQLEQMAKGAMFATLSILDIKEKFMEWRQHWRVIKKEIAMKQKDALGKSFISDQAQHGK